MGSGSLRGEGLMISGGFWLYSRFFLLKWIEELGSGCGLAIFITPGLGWQDESLGCRMGEGEGYRLIVAVVEERMVIVGQDQRGGSVEREAELPVVVGFQSPTARVDAAFSRRLPDRS